MSGPIVAGGELPVTGAASGVLGGIGAGLAGLGALLVWLATRGAKRRTQQR